MGTPGVNKVHPVNPSSTNTVAETPQNCKFLSVPKVNLELWHDLPQNTEAKDLGLQEIQRNLVKSAQLMVQLFDSVLRAQIKNKMLAITFLRHASFLATLKIVEKGKYKPTAKS